MKIKNLEDIDKYYNIQKQLLEESNKLDYLNKWYIWYKKLKNKLNVQLNKNEYLRFTYNNYKFSIQVWKTDKYYDIILYNLASNYIDEFSNEKTIFEK